MLDIHRMILLREVKLRGGITAAARALSYTHSAVSQQLSQLEREAGVPLLQKVGRGVRLTSEAHELVRCTDQIMALMEKAESELASSHSQVRGALHLAAFSTVSRIVVPRIIDTLTREFPSLEVTFRQVEPEDGLLLLSSRSIDVLVADSYGPSNPVPTDLHSHLLTQDPIRAYLPSSADATTLAGLRRLRWVLEPGGSEAHSWALGLCKQFGFEPIVAYESADLLFHLRMVEHGLAAAFLPDSAVREFNSPVTPSPLLKTHQQRRISLICAAGAERRPSVVACRKAFEDFLSS